MLTFNDLKRICGASQIPVEKIAQEIGLSYDGLKKGLTNSSLSLRYVLPLCNAICITPNKFFGIEADPGDTIYGAQNKGGKKQIIQQGNTEALEHTIEILKEQLTTKDEQIAAKDRQINKLLGL